MAKTIKRCHLGTRCPLKWTCRSCGATCCEHTCANKVGELATCSSCKLSPSRTSPGVSVPLGDPDDLVYRCRCSWVGGRQRSGPARRTWQEARVLRWKHDRRRVRLAPIADANGVV